MAHQPSSINVDGTSLFFELARRTARPSARVAQSGQGGRDGIGRDVLGRPGGGAERAQAVSPGAVAREFERSGSAWPARQPAARSERTGSCSARSGQTGGRLERFTVGGSTRAPLRALPARPDRRLSLEQPAEIGGDVRRPSPLRCPPRVSPRGGTAPEQPLRGPPAPPALPVGW